MGLSGFLNDEERQRANKNPKVTKWLVEKAERALEEYEAAAKAQSKTLTKVKEENAKLRKNAKDAKLNEELTEKLKKNEEVIQEKDIAIAKLTRDASIGLERLTAAERLANFRKDEIARTQVELHETMTRYRDSSQRCSTLEDEVSSLRNTDRQAEIALSERKLDLKDKEIAWLRESLEERIAEVNDMRADRDRTISNLESRLETTQGKLCVSTERIGKLESEVTESRRTATEALDRLHQTERLVSDDQREMENQLQTESSLRKALKARSEDLKDENQRLCEQLKAKDLEFEEEKERVKGDFETIRESFKQQIKDLSSQHKADIEVLKKENEQLIAEVDKSKEQNLLVGHLSKSAASIVLESQGLSATDLYNEVADSRKQVIDYRSEIAVLKDHLRRILRDIERRAPEVAKLRQNYDAALEAYDEQADALHDLVKDADKLREENCSLKKRTETLQDELDHTKIDAADLARQVQHLLVQKSGSPRIATTRGSYSRIYSSPVKKTKRELENVSLVDSDLVTCDGIEDMQQQNQKLRASVRRLSSALESAFERIQGRKKLEEDKEISSLKDELVNMRESRVRQEKMVVAIANQRDMYRVLLMQADMAHVHNTVEKDGKNHLMIADSQDSSLYTNNGANRDMSPVDGNSPKSPLAILDSAEVDYRSQLASLSKEFSDFRESAQKSAGELQRHIDEQKSILSDSRLIEAKAVSDKNHMKAQCDMLKSQLDSARAEVKHEQEQREKLFSECLKSQELFAERGRQIDSLTTKLSSMGIEAAHAKSYANALKTENSMLSSSIEDMRRQRDTQSSMVSSFKQIEDSQCAEMRISLASSRKEIQRLEEQLDETKTHLREARQTAISEELKRKNVVADMKENIAALEKKANEYLISAQNHQTEIRVLNEREMLLKNELQEMRRRSPPSVDVAAIDASDPNVKESPNKSEKSILLQEKLLEISKLKSLVESKSKDCETFRAISKSNEDALRKLSDSSEVFKKSNIAKLEAVQKERNTLQSRLDELEKQSDAKQSKEQAETVASKEEIRIVKNKLAETEKELDAARSELSSAHQKANALKEEAEHARENYARELQLHASAASELSSMRERIQRLDEERRKLSLEAHSAKHSLEIEADAWAKEKALLEKQQESSKLQQLDLSRQNELLVTQTEQLQERIAHVQSQVFGEFGSPSGNTDKEGNANEQDEVLRLRELLKIEHRQREVAVLEGQETELRVTRLEKKLRAAEAELHDSKEKLKSEIERVGGEGSRVIDVEEHNRLLGAVAENSLIRGMHAMLVSEKDKLSEKLLSSEKVIEDLQSKLKPHEAESRKAEAAHVALEAEKEALLGEVKLYKERYDQLLSSYGDKIDPTEHKKLQEETTRLKLQFKRAQDIAKEARLSKAQLEKEKQELVDQKQAIENEKIKANDEKQAALTEKDNIKAEKEKAEKELTVRNLAFEKKENVIAKMRVLVQKLREENANFKQQSKSLMVASKEEVISTSSSSRLPGPSSSDTAAVVTPLSTAPESSRATKLGKELNTMKAQLLAKSMKLPEDKASPPLKSDGKASSANETTTVFQVAGDEGSGKKRALNPSAPPFTPSVAVSSGNLTEGRNTSMAMATEAFLDQSSKRLKTGADSLKKPASESLQLSEKERREKEVIALRKMIEEKKRAKAAESLLKAPVDSSADSTPTSLPSSAGVAQGTQAPSAASVSSVAEMSEEEKIRLRRQRFGATDSGLVPSAVASESGTQAVEAKTADSFPPTLDAASGSKVSGGLFMPATSSSASDSAGFSRPLFGSGGFGTTPTRTGTSNLSSPFGGFQKPIFSVVGGNEKSTAKEAAKEENGKEGESTSNSLIEDASK